MNTIEDGQLLLEQTVLGDILLSNKEEQIDKIESLDINLFDNEYNKDILKTMKELIKKDLYVDIVLLKQENPRIDTMYLTDMSTYVTLYKYEDYIYKLKQNKEYRNAKEIINNALIKIDTNNYQSILSDVVKNIENFEENSANNIDSNESRIMEAFINILDNIHSEIKYPNWGIKALDKFSTGVKPCETTVIAGKSGLGKTALISQILLNLFKQDKKIIFFNLELPIELLLKRIFSTTFAVSVDEIDKCKNNTKLQDGMHDLIRALIKDNKFILRDDVRTVEQMRQIIRNERPDIVAVDYLQLCQTDRICANREQEVAYVSREFKEISKQYKCHVFQLSQVNADGIDHRPHSEKGMRESKAIYHSVDNCIYLWEPTSQYFSTDYANRTFLGPGAIEMKLEDYEEYEKFREEKGFKLVEIIFDKQRNGKTGRDISLFSGPSNRYMSTYFENKKINTNINNKQKSKPKL